MTLNRLALSLLVTTSAFCASCANVPLTESGFLGDYSLLQRTPDAEVWGVPDTVHLYRSDVLDEGGYDAIMVDPAVWIPSPEHDFDAGEKKTAWLLEEFSTCLAKGVGKEFELVHEPRPGALRLRPAMTAVDPANVWINVPLVFLLVPIDMGGISGEIEVVDSMSGDRVFAMTARREGNPLLILETFTSYGQARHGMYKWSRMIARRLKPGS